MDVGLSLLICLALLVLAYQYISCSCIHEQDRTSYKDGNQSIYFDNLKGKENNRTKWFGVYRLSKVYEVVIH